MLSPERVGRYRLRTLRIGFRPTETAFFDLATDTTIEVRVSEIPLRLPIVSVREAAKCDVRPDSGLATWALWDEVKTALLATSITLSGDDYVFDAVHAKRLYDLDPLSLRYVAVEQQQRRAEQPWRSLPVAEIARNGYVSRGASGIDFAAPDFDVLLSPYFAANHCFRLSDPVRSPPPRTGLIGIDFMPTGRRSTTEIRGTFWIDAASRELSRLQFFYTNLPIRGSDTLASGEMDFLRLSTGEWVIPHWAVRSPMPDRASQTAGATPKAYVLGAEPTRPVRSSDERWLPRRVQITRADLRSVRAAGSPDTNVLWSRATAVLRVAVKYEPDSTDPPGILPEPASGALVWIAGSATQTVTDTVGRASLSGLVEGDYFVDVTSVTQDALRVPSKRFQVAIGSRDTTAASFEVMSPKAAAEVACEHHRDGLGIVIGTVRRDGQPVVGAHLELTFVGPALARRKAIWWGSATTDSNGYYGACGVPRDRPFFIVASMSDSAVDTVRARMDDRLYMVVDLWPKLPTVAPSRPEQNRRPLGSNANCPVVALTVRQESSSRSAPCRRLY